MRILYSQTGSNGNCSVIESGDGHILIIDAGLHYKKVDKEIGYKLHKADALLITHAHKDHTEFLREFLALRSKIYVGEKIFKNIAIKTPVWVSFIISHERIDTEGFVIIPFPLVHTNSDGTDCENFGFLILDKSSGEKMLWATDTQYISNRFPPLEYYCIESNYFEKSYDGEAGYVQKSVEMRRAHSHMSFETACDFLQMQDLSKCNRIRLLHVSNSFGNGIKYEMQKKLAEIINNKLGRVVVIDV